jgi:hypothetical protein
VGASDLQGRWGPACKFNRNPNMTVLDTVALWYTGSRGQDQAAGDGSRRRRQRDQSE